VEHGSANSRSQTDDPVEHGSATDQPATGEPSVTVTVGTTETGFYVEDDGPGIPDDEKVRVFDQGFTTDTDGTGFGLYIVQALAEAHGWSVSVADAERETGARFEIDTSEA
jgi:signal transduction histidine kinase